METVKPQLRFLTMANCTQSKKVFEEFWYEGFIVVQDKKRDLALMYMVSDGKKKFDLIQF